MNKFLIYGGMGFILPGILFIDVLVGQILTIIAVIMILLGYFVFKK